MTVANRLVELAVVEKKDVDVAFVVVEFTPVKFCNVDEAEERKPPVRVEKSETMRFVVEAVVAVIIVVEAYGNREAVVEVAVM